MRTSKKIAVSLIILITVMLILPLLVVNAASPDLGMSLTLLLFFIINPITLVLLGVIAGSNVRILWWIPVLCAAVFPPFFAVAIQELVAELWIYSGLYLCIGILSMLARAILLKKAQKRSDPPQKS